MAFIAAAAELRLRKIRLPASAREEMLRSWPVMLLVAIATMVVFIRSCDLPLVALLPFERLPHLRESIFATQPFLFLLLNSMIFAVLAPSGLFNDSCCSSASADELRSSSLSRSSSSSLDSRSDSPVDRKPATNPDDNQAPDPPSQQQQHGDPEPPPIPVASSTDLSRISDPAPQEKEEIVRESPRPSNASPPKARVKRVKKMKKSVSSSAVAARQITAVTGIVGSDRKDSLGDPTDSLKDEDFKHFIDSFIAQTRHQMLRQEWEYRRTI